MEKLAGWPLSRLYLVFGSLCLVASFAVTAVFLATQPSSEVAPAPAVAPISITRDLDGVSPRTTPKPQVAASPQIAPEEIGASSANSALSSGGRPAAPPRAGIVCDPPGSVYMYAGKTTQTVCHVGATNGFDGFVDLTCQAPADMTCSVEPSRAAPKSPVLNDPGNVPVTLTMAALADGTTFGIKQVQVKGASSGSDSDPLQPRSQVTVDVERLAYSASCRWEDLAPAAPGALVTVACSILENGTGFHGPVYLAASSPQTGASPATVSPAVVVPQAGSVKNFSVTIQVPDSATPGSYRYEVKMSHIKGGPPLPAGARPPAFADNEGVLVVTEPEADQSAGAIGVS